MPKWLIAVLVFVGLALVGVNIYLFYSYFTFKAKPSATPVIDEVSTPTISLSGEIKPGWQLPLNQGFCAKSYYLVTDTTTVEVRPQPNSIPDSTEGFKRYANTTVNITGKNHAADSLSCGEFISVETLGSTGSNTNPLTLEGTIACLPGSEVSEEGCIQALQIGDAYLALIQNEAVLINLEQGSRMRVIGIVDNTFSSPENFDAGIVITMIEKI